MRFGLFLVAAFLAAQGPPLDQPDARTLIAQSAVATKKYQSYQLESVVTVDMRGGHLDTRLEMPSSISVRRPDRMRIYSKSQAGTMTIASDGEHTWFYLSAVKKYVKRNAVGLPEAAVSNSGLLPKGLPDVAQAVKSTRITGEDTIDVAGTKIPCWMVETTFGQILLPEQHLVIRNAVQTTWISRAEKLSLQNTFSGEVDMAGVSEPVIMTQSTRTTALRLNPKLPDSVFVFTPPVGTKETADWTLPGIAKPDLEAKPAPTFAGQALDGSTVDLSALNGKIVLLDFWASWCVPCRRDLPVLEKLQTEFRDRGLAVVGIDVGEERLALDKFLKTTPLSFPIVPISDSSDLITALSVNAFPTLVLIDRDGNVASYEAGALGEAALRAVLAKVGLGDPSK
ncbi:MAG TPA: redoxin family protein [Bryobacteraceae bacterium]|nr:redoxin family protein [Bryobacteraceae bacterium]